MGSLRDLPIGMQGVSKICRAAVLQERHTDLEERGTGIASLPEGVRRIGAVPDAHLQLRGQPTNQG